jgi:malate dehydrogenase (oxaloacetate-decarboxylating)
VATVPSVSYSITVRLEVPAGGKAVSQLTHAVENAGGVVTALDVTTAGHETLRIDVTCAAKDTDHAQLIVDRLGAVEGVHIHKVSDRTFLMHLGGKIEMQSKVPLRNRDELSMAYTPGVARVSMAIARNPEDVRRLTVKRNSVAVVTDGSAVLGLGNIGPAAALPVMEGKAALFKRFAGIPVFHDDQHGTAICVLAALTNALRVVNKKLEDVRITMAGAGAAGTAVLRLLLAAGARNVIVCDYRGAIHLGRDDLDDTLRWIAENTNAEGYSGDLRHAVRGADVFIGVSAPGILTGDDIATMADDAVVFALANPDPEVSPDEAREHAAVVATGRSDYPNQINNVLAFPGVFRGLLDAQSRTVTEDMLLAAARALAAVVTDEELGPNYIIPSVFHPDVASAVASAVREAAGGRARGMTEA